jgi:hypothetical protein
MGHKLPGTPVIVAALSLVLQLSACGQFLGFSSLSDPDLGAISKTKIYIDDVSLRKLYESVAEDDYAPCIYIDQGSRTRAWIKVRGFTSRLDPKKSFTLKLDETGTLYALERVTGSGANNRMAMYAYTIAYRSGDPHTGKALPAPSIDSTALFVNDEYLGCYNWIEMYSEENLRDHYHEQDAELFKAYFEDMGYDHPIHHLSEKKFPDDLDFSALDTMIYNARSMDTVQWADWVSTRMDSEDIVKYLAVHNYLGVLDTSWSNFYIYDYGKMLILPWDNEDSFILSTQGFEGNNLLTRRLLQDPAIRSDYNSEMQRLFLTDATLDLRLETPSRLDLVTPESTENIVDDLITEAEKVFVQIDRAMYYDPTFYVTYDGFLAEKSNLLNFLYNRSAVIPEIPLP